MIHVIETRPHQITNDDTRLTFIGDDNKAYDATFTASARAQLLGLLQVETARRLEIDAIPLTVTGSTVVAAAQGFALVVETSEAGPIALQIAQEQLVSLRRSLVELETYAQPQQRM